MYDQNQFRPSHQSEHAVLGSHKFILALGMFLRVKWSFPCERKHFYILSVPCGFPWLSKLCSSALAYNGKRYKKPQLHIARSANLFFFASAQSFFIGHEMTSQFCSTLSIFNLITNRNAKLGGKRKWKSHTFIWSPSSLFWAVWATCPNASFAFALNLIWNRSMLQDGVVWKKL